MCTHGRSWALVASLNQGLHGLDALIFFIFNFPGACRTLGVESEDAPQRGQFLPDSPPHSGAMGQEDGKKWAAAAHPQPTIPKPDRLLAPLERGSDFLFFHIHFRSLIHA